MARPCTVCRAGAVRSAIETDALLGSTIRSLASGYRSAGLSESAIRRHLHSHVQRTPLRPVVVDDALSLADAVGAVASGVREMRTVREAAIQRGDTTATIRATAEGRASAEALGKLGIIDADAVATSLDNFERLQKATQRATRNRPEHAADLASAAMELHDDELATEAEEMALRAQEYLDRKKEK